jgi:hypothetical protein
MKAKLQIGILGALLLQVFPANGQIAETRDYRNDRAGLVVNNYYNYDYFYSSRINRFHRAYSTFSYYSPVFTDSYWYTYRPYSLGMSIYGGGRIGFGIAYNYPLYYDYGWYGYGWENPSFGGSYYWGYDPFYYSWYSPVVINIRVGGWWPRNYYSWHGHNYWWNSSYRPVYNQYNYYNYYSNDYPSYNNSSRRRSPVTTSSSSSTTDINRSSTSTGSRRETAGGNQQYNTNNNSRDKSNNGLHLGETRRYTNPSNTGGTPVNTGSRGNDNNVNPGNQGNSNRRYDSNSDKVNNMNNGNNNNLNPGNTGNVNRGSNTGSTNQVRNYGNQGQGNTNTNIRTNQGINQSGGSRLSTGTSGRTQTISTPVRRTTSNSGSSTVRPSLSSSRSSSGNVKSSSSSGSRSSSSGTSKSSSSNSNSSSRRK